VSITILLADDHPLILRGLDTLLRSESDFVVLAQFASGTEALHGVRVHRPDIMVLDIRMPGKDGLAVMREMKEEGLSTRVVLLAASLDEEELLEATRLGVGGVVLKEMAPRLLVQCIRKVHAGESWVERRMVSRALEVLLRREAAAREISKILTAREMEIARLAAKGFRNEVIGAQVSVSEATVKTHLHNIYQKLHVASRAELILYFKEKGVA
jgi:DNA-binding NarL/FixJ family response regulator